jgi:hypothetical protein
MTNTIIWAVGTFAITCTVWVAILILERKRRESALGEMLAARVEELEAAQDRIAELEEKLDLAERQLLQSRPEERLPLRP